MLQFQCPHCQAVIRVRSSAMGQSGTCQSCNQKIRVPTIQPPPCSEQEAVEEIQLESQQAESSPAENAPTEQQAVHELLSALSSPPEKPTCEDPILNVTERRKSNHSFMITGLLFLIIGGCGAIAFYYLSQPLMQAELKTQIVTVDAIKPTLLSRNVIQQPELFEAFWLKHPGKKIEINSRLLETSILAQKRGLELRLYPGPENNLYRVDLLENKTLRQFYAKHSSELEKLRKEVLLDATNSFLEQMVEKEELLRRNSHLLIEIRDRMILTAMVRGLGFRLIAETKGKQFPCVWQDKQDRLYFSLPKGTTRFIIREIEIAGQKKFFPKTLKFVASLPSSEKPKQKELPSEPLISKEKKEEKNLEEKEPQSTPKEDEAKPEDQQKKETLKTDADSSTNEKMKPEN